MIFLYAHKGIQWSNSDYHQIHAIAGISTGDGINFNTIPESQTANITNIDKTSNVGIPGVWMFQAGKSMLPVLDVTFLGNISIAGYSSLQQKYCHKFYSVLLLNKNKSTVTSKILHVT